MSHYKLHSHCFLTKGPLRSIIVDLERRRYETIPCDMHDLIDSFKDGHANWAAILDPYAHEDRMVLNQYLDWLLTKEYVFKYDTTHQNLKPVPLIYESAFLVDSAIIDLSSDSKYSVPKVLAELAVLRCKSLQIRDYDGYHARALTEAILMADDSFVCNIHVLLKATERSLALEKMLLTSPRVSSIVIHGCSARLISDLREFSDKRLTYTPTLVTNEACCGAISERYFTVNHRCASLGLFGNTCLYKKISVDRFGNIKNCPSSIESYGRLQETTLESALEDQHFRSLWHITKSQVEVCKDCEFRMICTDCRAYRKDMSNLLSKPLKCNYDPYSAQWSA